MIGTHSPSAKTVFALGAMPWSLALKQLQCLPRVSLEEQESMRRLGNKDRQAMATDRRELIMKAIGQGHARLRDIMAATGITDSRVRDALVELYRAGRINKRIEKSNCGFYTVRK